MTRNTEKRVEIATPVLDEEIRHRIIKYLEIQMQDNVGARLMNSEGEYEKIEIENEKISSQNYFISEAEDKIIASVDSKKENTEENNLKRKNKEKNHGLFLNKLLKIFKK